MRILIGGLVVGVLDGAYAVVFSAFHGVRAARVFQSISSGFYGREAFNRGTATVVLGVVLHFFIATTIVLVYWVAGRRIQILGKHPFLCGAVYGLLVYLFMNLVVIPLSAVPFRPRLPAIIGGVIVHVVMIGIPAALFGRDVTGPASQPAGR